MKGIILLLSPKVPFFPTTFALPQYLFLVYDKPMLHYSISLFIDSGISTILIICPPEDIHHYESHIGNGNQLGISITYRALDHVNGLANIFIIAEDFIDGDCVALVFGECIITGKNMKDHLYAAAQRAKYGEGSTLFAVYTEVSPYQHTVPILDDSKKTIILAETLESSRSYYCIPNLYYYDGNVVSYVKELVSTTQKEIGLIDINNYYLAQKETYVDYLDSSFTWINITDNDSLFDASRFIRNYQESISRVGSLSENAYNNGWICEDEIRPDYIM